jgi:hypothetical protein
MIKLIVTRKEIERMRIEIAARFAFSHKELYVLFVEEYSGFLKRKGVDIDVEVEEVVVYADGGGLDE